MSLATRCPSCGTVFRVVQDQLRVSEGWVRCGRCNGVFNAAEVLFDIDTGAPMRLDMGEPAEPPAEFHAPAAAAARPAAQAAAAPPPPPPAAPPTPPADTPWPLPGEASTAPDDDRFAPRLDDLPAWAAAAPPSWPAPASGPVQREEPLLRAPSARPDDEIIISDHVPSGRGLATAEPPQDEVALSASPATPMVDLAGTALAAADAAPSFMRSAERTARWHSPAMRSALTAAVLLLAVTLLLQAALIWRDTLAAHLPASEAPLRALCKLTGCSVQPLRRLDALAVDSSGLNRLEGSTLYRLQVVLHNRADTAVMMPALDLSLTDAQGKPVSRRVLQVAELGAAQPVLQAGQELPLKVLVSTGEQRVDGYTLELFYP